MLTLPPRRSPLLGCVPFLTVLLPTLSYIFPDWLMNKLLRLVPDRDIKRMLEVSDTMTQCSLAIINDRKSALLKGDNVLVRQVGAGKDNVSLLCECASFHLPFVAITYQNSVLQ